jgi:hypothetical protein
MNLRILLSDYCKDTAFCCRSGFSREIIAHKCDPTERTARAIAMDKTNIIPSEHLARSNEPEVKQEISNIFA